MTTAETLHEAATDLATAAQLTGDAHRSRQYALSARAYAAEVLLAADATAAQRHDADTYLHNANAIIA